MQLAKVGQDIEGAISEKSDGVVGESSAKKNSVRGFTVFLQQKRQGKGKIKKEKKKPTSSYKVVMEAMLEKAFAGIIVMGLLVIDL